MWVLIKLIFNVVVTILHHPVHIFLMSSSADTFCISVAADNVCPATGNVCKTCAECPIYDRIIRTMKEEQEKPAMNCPESFTCAADADTFVNKYGYTRDEIDHVILCGFVPYIKNRDRNFRMIQQNTVRFIRAQGRADTYGRAIRKMHKTFASKDRNNAAKNKYPGGAST